MVRSWYNAGKRVLVFINQFDVPQDRMAVSPWASRGRQRVVWGSPLDSRFMLEQFAPAMIDSLPDLLLGLGRFFPLFRIPIAHYLINDTCFSNAAYALSTGLAEIVAVLDIPITIADSIILTKSQAFLVYKLGLALGYSTRWQDYIAEFGGVLGGGFVWRQIARSLVGLIPVWGIIPKTGIAYAGTYVVGNVVLQWYLTGKQISGKQMQAALRAGARTRQKPGGQLAQTDPTSTPAITPAKAKAAHPLITRPTQSARLCKLRQNQRQRRQFLPVLRNAFQSS